MEHVGCNLISDFRDYYDQELCCTPLSYQLDFHRNKSSAPGRLQQWQLLSHAGMTTPVTGTLFDVMQSMEQRFGHPPLNQDEWLFAAHSPQGDIRLHSWNTAKCAPQNTPAMQLVANEQWGVIRYVQIGHLSAWLHYDNDETTPFSTQSQPTIFLLNEALPPFYGRNFLEPVFSIDFIQRNKRLVAFGYDPAPHLGDMGLARHFPTNEVAKAIMDRLDHSPAEQESEEQN